MMGLVWCPLGSSGSEKASFYLSAPRPLSQGQDSSRWSHLKVISWFKMGIGGPAITAASQVLPGQRVAGRAKGVSFLVSC